MEKEIKLSDIIISVNTSILTFLQKDQNECILCLPTQEKDTFTLEIGANKLEITEEQIKNLAILLVNYLSTKIN